jgi:hypothetical protein
MSAASTRRRSTRSAAKAGIQPAVAMSATTKKVRITRIASVAVGAEPSSVWRELLQSTHKSGNRPSRALTFLCALFLHSIVERLLHGLRRDYWRNLWTRSREGKGAGWQLLRSL